MFSVTQVVISLEIGLREALEKNPRGKFFVSFVVAVVVLEAALVGLVNGDSVVVPAAPAAVADVLRTHVAAEIAGWNI